MITKRLRFVVFVLVAVVATQAVNVAARALAKPSPDPGAAGRADAPVSIEVSGDVSHPTSFTGDQFAKLPRRTVGARGHDGVESQYEGVALIDLLAKAGAPTGKDLRGPAMASYVIVEAADRYRALFALAEFDPAFTDRVILLADRRDGKPLSASAGPFQVVVPGEKKHARWVKQVIKLKVGRA